MGLFLEYLKEQELLIEMPQLIHLDDTIIRSTAKEVQSAFNAKKMSLIEKYDGDLLYHMGNDNDSRYGLFSDGVLCYFVWVKLVELDKKYVRQVLVHRADAVSAASAGIVHHVIFHILLPKYERIASDCQQSDRGQRMWQHLVKYALHKGMGVTLYDSNDRTHTPINGVEDLNKYKIWGTSSWYQRRILTISN